MRGGEGVACARQDGYWCTCGRANNGVVRYVGPTTFAVGTWVGIELDNAVGKHDGEVRRAEGDMGAGCVCV